MEPTSFYVGLLENIGGKIGEVSQEPAYTRLPCLETRMDLMFRLFETHIRLSGSFAWTFSLPHVISHTAIWTTPTKGKAIKIIDIESPYSLRSGDSLQINMRSYDFSLPGGRLMRHTNPSMRDIDYGR